MASLATRAVVNLLYRSPFNPKSTDSPDDAVVDLVEGPLALPPGRALDLGCGSGRHAIYLARNGWEVTGVDLVRDAVESARQKAEAAAYVPGCCRATSPS
ncbi:MAG TPA: class I SAM-dependent methyltransferase [Pseudonocardiaceae bacterium]|jgi:2-polyprenyl-3-methyl-5-hydroxy-6-metoxy-1,4-benzoquinol methylase